MEHPRETRGLTLFRSNDGNSVRGFRCSNFILSNNAQVICGGRPEVEHTSHCLLAWYQHAVNVCFPRACGHHNSYISQGSYITFHCFMKHKPQEIILKIRKYVIILTGKVYWTYSLQCFFKAFFTPMNTH
jgi:hypothetical protein